MAIRAAKQWWYFEGDGQFGWFLIDKSQYQVVRGKLGTAGKVVEKKKISVYATAITRWFELQKEWARGRMKMVGAGRGKKVEEVARVGWAPPWGGIPPIPRTKLELVVPKRLPKRFREYVGNIAAITGPWVRSSSIVAKKSWQPPTPFLVVEGDLVAGAIAIRDGEHDFGFVIVTGSIQCSSLAIGTEWSLICFGNITVRGVIDAQAADSTTYVAGDIRASRIRSGRGAWLTIFDAAQLGETPVTGYVMVGNRAVGEV